MQVVQRWILARLRNQRFFSLAELNSAIRALTTDLNNRTMRHLGTTRRALFEAVERPAPLPSKPYAYAEWKRCRAGLDYHVEVHGHFYSVPYRLVREVIEARVTEQTIELFHGGMRVASHLRNPRQHRHTATPDHVPSAHRRYAEWTPTRLLREAAAVGPATVALVERILTAKPYPEQGSGPASASCAWRAPMAPSGWRPPASVAWTSAPARTGRCAPSCRTASTGPTAPTPRRTNCRSSTATSAAAATTIEEDDTMLTHPTTDRLRELGLAGMVRALEEQQRQPDNIDLGFEDRLAMLVDCEALERDTKHLAARLRFAGLR